MRARPFALAARVSLPLAAQAQVNPEIRPFVGAGRGMRTYDPTGPIGAKSYPAGYGAFGTEFQLDRMAIRLEGRDDVTRFKGLDGNADASNRNELGINVGLAYHLRWRIARPRGARATGSAPRGVSRRPPTMPRSP